MSNNQVAIDTLLAKMKSLEDEKKKAIEKFDAQIHELAAAITVMTGGTVYENLPVELYNDENPDYIRGTEDGI